MNGYINFENYAEWHDDGYDLFAYYNEIEKLPKIDIVRCLECKGLRKHELIINDKPYITSYWCERVYPNIQIPDDQVGKHFCSFGESKIETDCSWK